ncbi:MAG TPA: hypothetical protein VFJ82_21960 [Longimicrobium sp.]|nr:hypothetical protein [Longimicrobium sp.]
MIRHLPIPLLAAVFSACATIAGSGVDREDTALPQHLAHIPIYWAGTMPQCTIQPVGRVSALSRAALRERAFERGGDAVVDTRVQSRAESYSIGQRRSLQTDVNNIYYGMAVKLADKCTL